MDESDFEVFGTQRTTFVSHKKIIKRCHRTAGAICKHGGGKLSVRGSLLVLKWSLNMIKGILNKEGCQFL